MGNVSGFTGGDAVQRGQNAGEQPRRVDAGKGGKLLGPGGQQDIALCFGEKLRRVHGRLEHHASCREGAFGPQQPVVFDLRRFARRRNVFGGIHCIRVGGVHAEVGPFQKVGHFLRCQPPAVHCDAGQTALLLGPQRGRHADEDVRPQRGQLFGKMRPSVVPLKTTVFIRDTPSV